jgi:hypothetical protein
MKSYGNKYGGIGSHRVLKIKARNFLMISISKVSKASIPVTSAGGL